MKKGILLTIVILLGTAGLIQAAEDIHGSVGVTYDSKYLWRGFDIYGDKSAIHPFVDLDLGQGFGINVTGHRANSSGQELNERWDYTLYYQNQLFPDETYVTNYRLGWMYYNYPDRSSHSTDATGASMDLQELHAIFSWPEICPAGIVPSYVLVKLWPSNSGSIVGSGGGSGTASGFAHIFMLDYGLPVTCPVSGNEQTLNLHTEVVYNDGVGPGGQNVDQDWSNAVFGVSTNYDLGNDLTFTPGVYHQVTMDKSVNPDKDETWASVTLRYAF